MSDEIERESKVTVNFTNNRLPDGTYVHHSIEGKTCPTCERLLTDHSREQLRECVEKARPKP